MDKCKQYLTLLFTHSYDPFELNHGSQPIDWLYSNSSEEFYYQNLWYGKSKDNTFQLGCHNT